MEMGYSIAPEALLVFRAGSTNRAPVRKVEEETLVEEEQKLARVVTNLEKVFLNGGFSTPEFGASLGGKMVRELDLIYSNPNINPNQREMLLGNMHRVLKPVVERYQPKHLEQSDPYNLFTMGFLGEFACMYALNKAGYLVKYPTLKQDTEYAIDCIVDFEKPVLENGGRYLYIQVKTFRRGGGQLLFPLRSQEEILHMCRTVPTSVENINSLYDSAHTLFGGMNQLDKGMAVAIIIPSKRAFNSLSGIPTKDMVAILGREIDTKILEEEEGVYE